MIYVLEINYKTDCLHSFEIIESKPICGIGKAFNQFIALLNDEKIDVQLLSVKALINKDTFTSFEKFVGIQNPREVFEKVALQLKNIIDKTRKENKANEKPVISEFDFRLFKAEKQRIAMNSYYQKSGKQGEVFVRRCIIKEAEIAKQLTELGDVVEKLTVTEISKLIKYDKKLCSLRKLMIKHKIKFKTRDSGV